MDVRPYPKGKYPKQTVELFRLGILRIYPEQVKRSDLLTDSGVDVVFKFKGLTPTKFERYVNEILMSAYAEAERYSDERYKFGRILIEMNPNAKGRTKELPATREYTASKNPDTDTMIWGTGVEVPEGASKPFLSSKAEEIIDILKTDSPGPYLNSKIPYKVLQMTICIRSGHREDFEARSKVLEKTYRPRMKELAKKVEEQEEKNRKAKEEEERENAEGI